MGENTNNINEKMKKVKKMIDFEKSQGKNSADCISLTI